MTKYKFTRKEIVNMWSDGIPTSIENDLLAKLSPEEESQKIMMEQVGKKDRFSGPQGPVGAIYTPIKDSKPIKEIELMDLQKFSLNDLGLTPPENHMIRLKINELVEAVNHLNQIK